MMKRILLLIGMIFLLSTVSAYDFYTKINTDLSIDFTCIDENTGNICSDSSYCNATLKDNLGATQGIYSGVFSTGVLILNLDGSNFTKEGVHRIVASCHDGSNSTTGYKTIEVNGSGKPEDTQGFLSKIIFIIFGYIGVYYLMVLRTKVPLWNFVGFGLLMMLSIILITFIDSPITFIPLGMSVFLFVDKLYSFLGNFWESEEG